MTMEDQFHMDGYCYIKSLRRSLIAKAFVKCRQPTLMVLLKQISSFINATGDNNNLKIERLDFIS